MAEVIKLPENYWVFDFTKGEDHDFECPYQYSIGRYDELRPGMYHHELFGGVRNLHVGIDIGGPVGEPIYSFADGIVHSIGINEEPGSYGPTIITKHKIDGKEIWALHGHLSVESLTTLRVGDLIKEGQQIASIGGSDVNGGWPPHLHFQLSWEEPESNDLPGVVRLEDRTWALERFPDPRIVLGPIY